MKEAIAVFDIGKTNKKLLVYDQQLQLIDHKEINLREIADEDGFPTEDLDLLVIWMVSSLVEKLQSPDYKIIALNFSCYGASIVHLDKQGNRVGSFYNYLKNTSPEFYHQLYNQYGGVDLFSEKTASPVLQFLNSGLQLYWLKHHRKNIWEQINTTLHFPQYLHYKFTRNLATDITSVGCHTSLWDFQKDDYHDWVGKEELSFPPMTSNYHVEDVEPEISQQSLKVGIGIHDSTSSIQPYMHLSQGKPFILISTGTWAINMNPSFKGELTLNQLENDCLSNINTDGSKILSSRFMLGRVHDVYCESIRKHFNVKEGFFKYIHFDEELTKEAWRKVDNGERIIQNYKAYSEEEAVIHFSANDTIDSIYHQMMLELTLIEIEQVKEIMEDAITYEKIYISGGFTRNKIFCKTIATYFNDIKVSTLSLENTSALGAALMILPDHWDKQLNCEEHDIKGFKIDTVNTV
ncbi:FGGY-family carbohydrate kinase [Flammeovirga pacifica]|uniref:Carbohydrate kinase FGGY N-terminal domain-containing protein n=1 Tax=Flammeovirga pacifica TaxID=915059 RepID=A0A1S1YSA9_FLAPC|nr:FGGY family carbohydrate kinase [Flammeovirga pacifica]OHX63909.1 hypothetical protein NH26_20065 [Flammeovirga pacifica]